MTRVDAVMDTATNTSPEALMTRTKLPHDNKLSSDTTGLNRFQSTHIERLYEFVNITNYFVIFT